MNNIRTIWYTCFGLIHDCWLVRNTIKKCNFNKLCNWTIVKSRHYSTTPNSLHMNLLFDRPLTIFFGILLDHKIKLSQILYCLYWSLRIGVFLAEHEKSPKLLDYRNNLVHINGRLFILLLTNSCRVSSIENKSEPRKSLLSIIIYSKAFTCFQSGFQISSGIP